MCNRVHLRKQPVRRLYRFTGTVVIGIATFLFVGCAKGTAADDAWKVKVIPSGKAMIVVFAEPGVIIKLDGVPAGDSDVYDQVRIVGSARSERSDDKSEVFRYRRKYENGVATIQVEDIAITVTDKGKRLAVGDASLTLTTKSRTVLAIDSDGKARKVGDDERNAIIKDADAAEM